MILRNLIAPLAFALAVPAVAQPVPSQDATIPNTPSADIVVKGPPSQAQRRRELRRMIASLVRNPRSGRTVATFLDAPCPEVFGLPEDIAASIEARILDNAAQLAANRRSPSEDCKRNISIIFIPPDKGPATSWLDEDSKLLRHLLLYERIRVVEEDGPVRAWSYKEVLSADGFHIPDTNGRDIGGFANFANRVIFATRLAKSISVELTGSVLMIELEQAHGKTPEQLADYATMRALANLNGIDPEQAPAASTILTLFQDDAPPQELTSFDRAFLSRLYRTARNSRKNRFYSLIAANVARVEQDEGLAQGQK